MSARQIALMCLCAAVLADASPASADSRPDPAAEFARRAAAEPAPAVTRAGDIEARLYKRAGKAWLFDHLVLARDGKEWLRLSEAHVDIEYARPAASAAPGPDLIVITYSGGAHCCTTIHVLQPRSAIKAQTINIRDSGLIVEPGPNDAPRLRFADYAFAYWKAPFSESPAPEVVLYYDPARGRYAADGPAMRKRAEVRGTLGELTAKIHEAFAKAPADGLPPALWRHMLDLIYTGQATAARDLLDQGWKRDTAAKERFWDEFREQLNKSEIWRRFALAKVLSAEAVIPPPRP